MCISLEPVFCCRQSNYLFHVNRYIFCLETVEKAVLRKRRCLNFCVISNHLHMCKQQGLCWLGWWPAVLVVIIDDTSFSCTLRFDQFSSVLLYWRRVLTSSWSDFSAHQTYLLRTGTCQGARFTGFLQAAIVACQSSATFQCCPCVMLVWFESSPAEKASLLWNQQKHCLKMLPSTCLI